MTTRGDYQPAGASTIRSDEPCSRVGSLVFASDPGFDIEAAVTSG
jgi:hypothetical protein